MSAPICRSLLRHGNTPVALWRMQRKASPSERPPVRAKSQQRLGPVMVRCEPEIEWRDYPRIQPGSYSAYCRFAKHYRDPGFRRWACLMRFDVFSEDRLHLLACVPCWLNLSNGEKPHAGRRSRYFAEWVRANGAPTRGDRLSPRLFVGRMALVEIGDTDPTKSPAPYSIVRKILGWETGGISGHSVNKSHSQGRHGLEAAGLGGYKE
jgi:hypothetical protein